MATGEEVRRVHNSSKFDISLGLVTIRNAAGYGQQPLPNLFMFTSSFLKKSINFLEDLNFIAPINRQIVAQICRKFIIYISNKIF